MLLLSLLVIPLTAGLLSLALCTRVWGELLNIASALALAALCVPLALRVAREHAVVALNGFLRVDALSFLVIALTSFLALACSIYAVGFFRREQSLQRASAGQLRLYHVLSPLFVSAMLLVPMADNLGIMWVAIESTTLASVLLVTFYGQKTSVEAGWKYIMIGSVGISLALFGTVITYSSAVGVLGAHADRGMQWSTLVQVAEKFDPTPMRLAFVMVLLGYGTKAGLVPMHTWKPDAYAEAPIPAATLMGAGLINCAIYAIMRFNVLAERCLGHAFPGMLLVGFGVLSVLVAAPFILAQRNYRRLLAYSSIDHAGLMVAAIGFGGKWGAFGAVLHMLYHALAKPMLFFSAGHLQQTFGSPYIRKTTGALQVTPWTASIFLTGMLAATGVPPFGLFQSEFTLLTAGVNAQNYCAVGLLLLGLVTVFAGFLVHASRICFGMSLVTKERSCECPWQVTAMLMVGAASAIVGVWLPAPVLALLRDAARIVGGAE